jgi:hypothetical protein
MVWVINHKLKAEILLVIYLISVLCIIQFYIQLVEYKSPMWFIFLILKIVVCIKTMCMALLWYWELLHDEI